MLFCDGDDWVEMGGGGAALPSCAAGQMAVRGASAWECATPAPAPDPAFYYCTNEQSDGDGTGDVAACVEAKIGVGPARYRTVSCVATDNNELSGATPKWNGVKWRVSIITSADCVDGTVLVVDTQASGGSGGILVGGYHWYQSAASQSCDSACAAHGGCNLAGTRDYAGSGGSNANCTAVLNALGAAGAGAATDSSFVFGTGCAWDTTGQRFRATSPATNCTAYAANTYRACACNN